MSHSGVRLRGAGILEVDVLGRTALLRGELLRPRQGHSGFWLFVDVPWEWADGGQISDEDRELILSRLPETARHAGIDLVVDEPATPRLEPPPPGVRVEFRGFNRLTLVSLGKTVSVEGQLSVLEGKPTFRVARGARWFDESESQLSDKEARDALGRLAALAPQLGLRFDIE
jgi:hypothetical protein